MCECGRWEGGREGGKEQTHMIYNKQQGSSQGERVVRESRAPTHNSTDSRQNKSRKGAERELE